MIATAKQMDIIDEFKNVVIEYCDSPEVFIESAGYYLVSALLGRFYSCPSLPHGNPNLWIVISSIPGRCRRSNVQNYTMKVYDKVMRKFAEEKLKNRNNKIIEQNKKLPPDEQKEVLRLTPKVIKDEINKTKIEAGTPEGIMDYLTGAKPGEHYTIVSTEFGGVLLTSGGTGYEKGYDTLLCKLAYGEGGKVLLSQRSNTKGKREVPEGLYVTMFAGMQEPEWYITKKQVRKGLLRRMIIEFVRKNLRWLPPLRFDRYIMKEQLTSIANKYILKIQEIEEKLKERQQQTIMILFAHDVFEEINNYNKLLDEELDKHPSDYNIYRQSFWEHLTKLAMCKAIASSKIMFDEKLGYHIYVNREHFNEAKKLFDRVSEGCMEAINSLGLERKNAYTHEELLDNLYNIVYNQPEHKIYGKTKLRRESKLLQKDFEEIFETLINTNRLQKRIEQPSRGRPREVIECVIDPDEEENKGWKEY